MDIIKMARELGKAIQEDDRYLALRLATQSNDEDQALQDMIGEFNLKRVSLNQEVQKADKDQEKLNQLDREIKELYQKIMSYPKMVVYNGAKKEVDSMMNYINRILVMSVNGVDPDSVEMSDVSCTGSCSTCGGCN